MTNAEARFSKIHIRKVYACLAVTCHLHFWQNDRDFLRATVVTRGWNGYRNKSQHRKSTLEKKILPPFQQGFEPATFQSRVRCCETISWIRRREKKRKKWGGGGGGGQNGETVGGLIRHTLLVVIRRMLVLKLGNFYSKQPYILSPRPVFMLSFHSPL